MACELAMQCNFKFRFLKCALPEDMINVNLKVHTLKGIHTFKKDYKSQSSRCSPWGAEAQPYSALRKKITEIMHRRQVTTTHYANKTYQSKPQKSARGRSLVQLTSKPDRSKLVRHRKVNVQKFL